MQGAVLGQDAAAARCPRPVSAYATAKKTTGRRMFEGKRSMEAETGSQAQNKTFPPYAPKLHWFLRFLLYTAVVARNSWEKQTNFIPVTLTPTRSLKMIFF